MDTIKRIQRAHVALLKSKEYVAMSGILMTGGIIIDDTGETPTAKTNGRDVIYGKQFIDSLTDRQVIAVVLHENGHKMYLHTTVWAHLWKQDPILANIAADFVVNMDIAEGLQYGLFEFWSDPEPLINYKYKGWSVGQVFDDLKKNAKPLPGGGYKMTIETQNGSKQMTVLGDAMDVHDIADALGMSKEEREQLKREIDSAIRQGAVLAGTGSGNAMRGIGDLLEVKTPWQDLLRDFVSENCYGHDLATWRRPNRRWLGVGVIAPSTYSERLDELVIGIDTSGSISEGDIGRFLSETVSVLNTCKPLRVHLLYWDTQVASHEVHDKYENLVQSTKPAGGGGTDPACVSQYLKDNKMKPDAIIMLTDGYVSSWGSNWESPLLWGILGNNSAQPDCGKALHLELDEL